MSCGGDWKRKLREVKHQVHVGFMQIVYFACILCVGTLLYSVITRTRTHTESVHLDQVYGFGQKALEIMYDFDHSKPVFRIERIK